jgi:hypothetical protein
MTCIGGPDEGAEEEKVGKEQPVPAGFRRRM